MPCHPQAGYRISHSGASARFRRSPRRLSATNPRFARSCRNCWIGCRDTVATHLVHSPRASFEKERQRQLAISGITCNRGSGLIEMSPAKGRSCASISNIDAATPVTKTPIAIMEVSRSPLWTMAIATRTQIAVCWANARPGAAIDQAALLLSKKMKFRRLMPATQQTCDRRDPARVRKGGSQHPLSIFWSGSGHSRHFACAAVSLLMRQLRSYRCVAANDANDPTRTSARNLILQ